MCVSKRCPASSDGEECEQQQQLEHTQPPTHGKMQRTPSTASLGRIIRTVLAQARASDRLICGLLPAIRQLEKAADDTVICLLAETRPGDATAHLQTVLLQAFCYENYIPVIKVDSSEKLSELCGSNLTKLPDGGGGGGDRCQCAIITRDPNLPETAFDDAPPMTEVERSLARFYEASLDEYPSPVVQLPR